METLRELQLGLWREACRHIDLADSISDLAAAIRPFVPFEEMWIFGIAATRCTFVAAVNPGRLRPGTALEGEDADSVARFVRRGGLSLFHPSRPGRSLLRPLATLLGPDPVACGALQHRGGAEGLVAWRLPRGGDLGDAATTLLAGTLEPLAAALDTSNRFHELAELRRAAEADRQSALRRLGRESLTEQVVGAEGGLRGVLERVVLVAGADVPVLILGETGSGKEVVARAIHDRSRRHGGPFLRVNCGAIAPELLDSQLFGHEKGAFTGATDQRAGWFERADGGTLFLDEIGELPLAAQVRLLRVLQDGTLDRVGGQHTLRVDCRIIAATHRDLAEMVRQRTFREDLWYRLAVFPLVIPPLRERREDLPALARHFAHRAATRFSLAEFEVRPADVEMLAAYDWPGNIRELAAVIDRAAILGEGHTLAIAAAMGGPVATAARAAGSSTRPTVSPLDEAIRQHIEAALRLAGGRVEGVGGAADLLRVNPHTLRSRMRKLKIDWAGIRTAAGSAERPGGAA